MNDNYHLRSASIVSSTVFVEKPLNSNEKTRLSICVHPVRPWVLIPRSNSESLSQTNALATIRENVGDVEIEIEVASLAPGEEYNESQQEKSAGNLVCMSFYDTDVVRSKNSTTKAQLEYVFGELIILAYEHRLYFFDLMTRKVCYKKSISVTCIEPLPLSPLLALGCADMTLRIFNTDFYAETIRITLQKSVPQTLHSFMYENICYLCCGLADGTVMFIDIKEKKAVATFSKIHNGSVNCLSYYPHLKSVISTANDKQLLIYPVWNQFSPPVLFSLRSPILYHTSFEHPLSSRPWLTPTIVSKASSFVSPILPSETISSLPNVNGYVRVVLAVLRAGVHGICALTLPFTLCDVLERITSDHILSTSQNVKQKTTFVLSDEAFKESKDNCRIMVPLRAIVGSPQKTTKYRFYNFIAHPLYGHTFVCTTNKGYSIVTLSFDLLPSCSLWWNGAQPILSDCLGGIVRSRPLIDNSPKELKDKPLVISFRSSTDERKETSKKFISNTLRKKGTQNTESAVESNFITSLEDDSIIEYGSNGCFFSVFSPSTLNLRVYLLNSDCNGIITRAGAVLALECVSVCAPALSHSLPRAAIAKASSGKSEISDKNKKKGASSFSVELTIYEFGGSDICRVVHSTNHKQLHLNTSLFGLFGGELLCRVDSAERVERDFESEREHFSREDSELVSANANLNVNNVNSGAEIAFYSWDNFDDLVQKFEFDEPPRVFCGRGLSSPTYCFVSTDTVYVYSYQSQSKTPFELQYTYTESVQSVLVCADVLFVSTLNAINCVCYVPNKEVEVFTIASLVETQLMNNSENFKCRKSPNGPITLIGIVNDRLYGMNTSHQILSFNIEVPLVRTMLYLQQGDYDEALAIAQTVDFEYHYLIGTWFQVYCPFLTLSLSGLSLWSKCTYCYTQSFYSEALPLLRALCSDISRASVQMQTQILPQTHMSTRKVKHRHEKHHKRATSTPTSSHSTSYSALSSSSSQASSNLSTTQTQTQTPQDQQNHFECGYDLLQHDSLPEVIDLAMPPSYCPDKINIFVLISRFALKAHKEGKKELSKELIQMTNLLGENFSMNISVSESIIMKEKEKGSSKEKEKEQSKEKEKEKEKC